VVIAGKPSLVGELLGGGSGRFIDLGREGIYEIEGLEGEPRS
jgi:hypothetical protein